MSMSMTFVIANIIKEIIDEFNIRYGRISVTPGSSKAGLTVGKSTCFC